MSNLVQSLPELLSRSAAAYGHRRFVVDSATGAELSFAGLDDASARIARALGARCGIRPGEHVAILMPNCLEILPAYFGILRAGCVAVPVNARLKADELQFILGDCEAQAVFVHPATWKPAQEALKVLNWQKPVIATCFDTPPPGAVPFSELLAPKAGETPAVRTAGVPPAASGSAGVPPAASGSAGVPPARGKQAEHGDEGGRDARAPKREDDCGRPARAPSRDDVAAIIYTSGTTGRPKGAMLTHGNVLFNIEATKAGHGFRGDDVHLLVVPLFHVTGLNTIMPTALEQGSCMVVSAAIDPEEVVETIHKFRCTTFVGVPTTFYLLANVKNLPLEKLSSLRLICYSGAPMSRLTIERLRQMFPSPLAGEGRVRGPRVELHNFYGLTETTSCTTVLPDSQALARAESVGLPPPGLELCIIGSEPQPAGTAGTDSQFPNSRKLVSVPAGAVGELCVRGPSVFPGYFKRPEATAEALAGGWFHTGDTACLDAEGYVFLRGRKKEMIIVAGENVYPLEVENVLCAHPAVREAAVFGRPDAALGEVVHAAVVLRPGEQLTERELRAFANERLAAFKLPRKIRFLDALPRNPSGKVVKRELTALGG
ncbi:MAG: AMP-binding protein [Planctomycetota bacterium]